MLPSLQLACLHDHNKSTFLEGSQSEQPETFSNSPEWLEKTGSPTKPFLF